MMAAERREGEVKITPALDEELGVFGLNFALVGAMS